MFRFVATSIFLICLTEMIYCGPFGENGQGQRRSLGGAQNANLSDSQTQTAIESAKTAINQTYDTCSDGLTADSATQQVVNGCLYNITFSYDPTKCPQSSAISSCNAQVFIKGNTVTTQNKSCTYN